MGLETVRVHCCETVVPQGRSRQQQKFSRHTSVFEELCISSPTPDFCHWHLDNLLWWVLCFCRLNFGGQKHLASSFEWKRDSHLHFNPSWHQSPWLQPVLITMHPTQTTDKESTLLRLLFQVSHCKINSSGRIDVLGDWFWCCTKFQWWFHPSSSFLPLFIRSFASDGQQDQQHFPVLHDLHQIDSRTNRSIRHWDRMMQVQPRAQFERTVHQLSFDTLHWKIHRKRKKTDQFEVTQQNSLLVVIFRLRIQESTKIDFLCPTIDFLSATSVAVQKSWTRAFQLQHFHQNWLKTHWTATVWSSWLFLISKM